MPVAAICGPEGPPVASYRFNPGDGGWTTSRAGNARYVNNTGVLSVAGTNVTRDAHYVNGRRTWLLETVAFTNSMLWSEDLTNAAWTKLGATPTTIGGSVTTPDGVAGSATCGQIGGNGAFTDQGVQQAFTWTASTAQAAASHFKPGNKSWVMIEMVCKDGTTITRSWFNVTTGAYGTTNHRTVAMYSLQNGWWFCGARINSSLTGASGQTVRFTFVDADNSTTLTGDGSTVNGYIFGSSHWVDKFFCQYSYIPTTTVPVAAVLDANPSRAHGSTPQARTLYMKLIDAQVGIVGGQAMWLIGAGSDFLRILNPNFNAGDSIRTDVVNVTTTAPSQATITESVQTTGTLEVRGWGDALFQSGTGISVNGGAEVTSLSAPNANPYQGAYGGANYTLCQSGVLMIIQLKDILGVQSMSACRAAI